MSASAPDPAVGQYDRFAHRYHETVEVGDVCAALERPTVLSLLDPRPGDHILDAACGSGPLSELLLARGAHVTAFDGSSAMVRLARERLGPTVDFRTHDLRDPLPYDDKIFDAVACSLALHYVRHWEPVLAEFARVLTRDGRVVISTHHPMRDVEEVPTGYLETVRIDDTWVLDGEEVAVSYWRRPLEDMSRAATSAGFLVEAIREPATGGHSRPHFLALALRTGR